MRIIESIPMEAIEYKRPEVADISQFLESRVVGQKAATDRVSKELVHVLSGLRAERQCPRGSLLMLGPSGVGKTETALAAVDFLLSRSKLTSTEKEHPEKFLLKIDCGEYSLKHQVATLIGSPTGYTGSKSAAEGSYTPPALGNEALAAHSFELEDGQKISVVLLDEIEKADETVRNFLLAALDKGITKNAANEDINFRDTLFLITSNLGNPELVQLKSDGNELSPEEVGQVRRRALMTKFRPEDVSRMSGSAEEAVIFEPLDRAASERILGIQLEAAEREFKKDGIRLEFQVTVAAKERLLDLGVNADTGARALKATLKSHIYQPLLHPSKSDNLAALHGQVVFIDYTQGSSEFSFYSQKVYGAEPAPLGNPDHQPETQQESGVVDKKELSPEIELTAAEMFGVSAFVSPQAKERLKELNVDLDLDALVLNCKNSNLIVDLKSIFKNNFYKKVEVFISRRHKDCIFIRFGESHMAPPRHVFIDAAGCPQPFHSIKNGIFTELYID